MKNPDLFTTNLRCSIIKRERENEMQYFAMYQQLMEIYICKTQVSLYMHMWVRLNQVAGCEVSMPLDSESQTS